MNAVLVYAHMPTPELRARRIPEQIISFVEKNRANLQRTAQQQQLFRGMVQKPNMPGQASEPGKMNRDVLGPFAHMAPTQQPGSTLPLESRPPQPQGYPSVGVNFTGTRNVLAQPQK